MASPAILQEQRVVTPEIVQEQRVLLPTLASANPALTTPVAILCPYPPPPGLPPLPDTDTANHLMDAPLTSPTVHIAPTRRTSRPHTIRAPSSFGYSVVIEDPSYLAILNGDLHNASRAPTFTKSEVFDLLSAADAARLGNIDHLVQANAAVLLNVNLNGSPLTFRTAKDGLLLDTSTMHGIQLAQQPSDRSDTSYYNPKPKEKYDDDMNKVYRIRGTAGGDRIKYDGSTEANTAAMPTVKILSQSVVSDNANFMTLDIKDFYLMTPLPRSEYIRIPLKFLSQNVLDKHNLHQFIHKNSVLFEVTKSMYGLPHAGKIAQDVLIERLAT